MICAHFVCFSCAVWRVFPIHVERIEREKGAGARWGKCHAPAATYYAQGGCQLGCVYAKGVLLQTVSSILLLVIKQQEVRRMTLPARGSTSLNHRFPSTHTDTETQQGCTVACENRSWHTCVHGHCVSPSARSPRYGHFKLTTSFPDIPRRT